MRILIIAIIIVGSIVAGAMLYPAYLITFSNETMQDAAGFKVSGGGVSLDVPTILPGEQSIQTVLIKEDGALMISGTVEGNPVKANIPVTKGQRAHKVLHIEADGNLKVDG